MKTRAGGGELCVFKITNKNPLKIHNVYKSKAYFEGKEKELEIPKVDYLEFVDSDDTISLDNVEECMKRFLQDKDIDIVWFYLEFVRDKLKFQDGLVLTPNEIFKAFIQNNVNTFWTSWGGVFDFNFLKKIKLKFTNGIIHEDHSFCARLFAQARLIAIINNKPLHYYRLNPTGIMRGKISLDNVPHYMSYLKSYFDNGDELKYYFRILGIFTFIKEIIDFIQNMPNSELKSLMQQWCYKSHLEIAFLYFINIQKDPLNLHKQALIYTGDNPQDYVIKTFEEASDEEKFRWIQKTLTMNSNPLKAQINTLTLKNTKLQNQIKKLNFTIATQRIHNHLAYKLGSILTRNSKSFFGLLKIPFLSMALTLAHKEQEKLYEERVRINPNLALPPLESYTDYQEALKEKECFTYKLGEAFMKAIKTWYKGGLVKFFFEAKSLYGEFKKKKAKQE